MLAHPAEHQASEEDRGGAGDHQIEMRGEGDAAVHVDHLDADQRRGE